MSKKMYNTSKKLSDAGEYLTGNRHPCCTVLWGGGCSTNSPPAPLQE